VIDLKETAGGVLLPVRAQPGSRRNGAQGFHHGALKVAVTQIAEKGKANRAVLEVVADVLGIKRSQVELVSGETSRDKVIRVSGLSPDEIRRRLSPSP
jgi:uncharacterized protein (TIGR00251 family)